MKVTFDFFDYSFWNWKLIIAFYCCYNLQVVLPVQWTTHIWDTILIVGLL